MRFFHCNIHNIDYPVEEGESIDSKYHCPKCMRKESKRKCFITLKVQDTNDKTIQTIHVRDGLKVEVALTE